MPPVRVKHVTSFSSQDPKHPVEDLVKGRGSWLSHPGDKSCRLQADLQLDWATTINYIDIGNAGSVMVSVEVGRSSWPTNQSLVTLLPAVSLMTPEDWHDMNSEAFKEKWDRVRVVCIHPFRRDAQFGLSLFRLHTNAEKELVSRMNLSEVKKKTISQKIGWLENKVLNNCEKDRTGPPLNPLTSPVSRAAHLISLAATPPSKKAADSHKVKLECEALEFLISLDLSLEDICSLKVLGVRQQFEKKEKKSLNHDEKVIFKNIALDYAKQRLENLEKQQENSSVKSSLENGVLENQRKSIKNEKENHRRHVLKSPENNKREAVANVKMLKQVGDRLSKGRVQHKEGTNETATSPSHPPRKFTFRRAEIPPGSPVDLLKRKTNSSHSVSNDRLKLRENDDLSSDSSLPSSHRNNLALSDSKVISPKNFSRGRHKRKLIQQSYLNKQSQLDVWISPKEKRKKQDKSFTYSNHSKNQFTSELNIVDDDLIVIDDEDDNKTSGTFSKCDTGGGFIDDVTAWQNANPLQKYSKTEHQEDGHQLNGWISRTSPKCKVDKPGFCLGASPADKFGTSRKKKQSQEDNLEIQSSSLASDGDPTMVECPLCSELFQSSEIESHAASCGTTVCLESEAGGAHFQRSLTYTEDKADEVEECPVCGDWVRSCDIEDHATDCANSMFD
ncbi:short transient receptor potential channel 2-like protein-like [Homarus americanus]|uniref:Short transient receptor potential channel 2-like protein-like n=1 Tax=Homarus americanus TaxID=6706 RepID=A0A8J5MQ37_HOMAM|nr:short transient receptor potential channel 2-like protein-like [Homarus americanus]